MVLMVHHETSRCNSWGPGFGLFEGFLRSNQRGGNSVFVNCFFYSSYTQYYCRNMSCKTWRTCYMFLYAYTNCDIPYIMPEFPFAEVMRHVSFLSLFRVMWSHDTKICHDRSLILIINSIIPYLISLIPSINSIILSIKSLIPYMLIT